MAVLAIRKLGDPVLRKKSEEVKEITPEIKELIFNMKETLQQAQGAGLAAPQVGESLRVIVVESKNGPKGFINPRIIKKTKESKTGEEGCLCLPGLFLKIKRVAAVEVEAVSEEGRLVKIQTEGLLSRIFQHEIDHLNGILIIDKIPFWQKWKLAKRLKK